ncbi:MAG TPA: DUF5312 family protein [Rectinemataceae bacterium]|nr:DUF5312 family protein [Rectinemataceae bacterium]
MSLLGILKEFFVRLLNSDPEESRRRAELRKLYTILAETRPPLYRAKQNLVLPGLAQAILQFYSSLRPLAEIIRVTVASPDVRVSQRYFDFLIECRLPASEQEKRRFFSYEGMSERVAASLQPEQELESISQDFQSFLQSISDLGDKEIDFDLGEVDRFIDICRHDYERLVGLFDPSASLDDPRYKPDFAPVPGEQILPELLDFYYLTEGFFFSPMLKEGVLRLLERRSRNPVDAAKRAKVEKLFSRLDKSLAERLSKDVLGSLIRATKGDPYFLPSTNRERREFMKPYMRRLSTQYEKDRERLLREQHESVVAIDIRGLFGEVDILPLEGYDEENDAYLRRESPNGFTFIKPLRILKTFIAAAFDPFLKESIKRILVEGYFENKNFQNNLANILYQCERSANRIGDFEQQLVGTGRLSITAMRRYIEEMRRGKDISAFLSRLVDAINGRAGEIVEEETGVFAMLGDALGDLLSDYRRSSPDLVTNIRNLGAGRNKEIMGQIQAGRDRIAILVKIMRNFIFVRASIPGALLQGSPATLELRAGAAQGLEAQHPDDLLPEAESAD